jgi:hypothetical protein
MPQIGLETVQMAYLQWLEDQEEDRQAKYATFRAYYDGEHQTQLTTRMRKFLEINSTDEFNLNFCPIVVDSLAERLKVTGFECEDQAETLWEWWVKNRLDALQGVVHLGAIRDGDKYLLVEWDNDLKRPRISAENAYDGSEGVHVFYSDERRSEPILATKHWIVTSGQDAKTRKLNLYYPDHIAKYSDGGTGNYALTEEQPWPYGITVVHFRNNDQGYSYGESELEDVLPIQNGLNKTFVDLLAAADTTGFRIYTMTGGDPSGLTTAPGQWVFSTDPAAKIGALDPADLAGLISLKDSIAADIAKVTRTPLSNFQLTGQVAAEGTLKQQEAGLIGRAKDRQVTFGNAWEDAMGMCRKLYNAFGKGGMDEEAPISTIWDDPETRNDKEHLEGLKVKRELGVPQETIWSEMGYDADQIEKMNEALQNEQVRGTQGLGAALLNQERAFNGGV